MIIIDCERDKTAKITTSTCVARQKVLDKGRGKNSWTAVQYRDCGNTCAGCKTGLELYKKYLKGELLMDIQTKKCPCGVVITRRESQNDISWRRVKYCDEHGKMNQYQRDKLFKKKTAVAPTKKPLDKPISKPDIEPEKNISGTAPEEIEMRTCFGVNGCGKPFPATLEHFQSGKEGSGSLDALCKNCRNKMRRSYRAQRKNALAIEISIFPGLLEKLQIEADKNLRTPEHQALWILKDAMG